MSHALLTRLPLIRLYAFDLHVLGLSLAFILSQDQTLVCSSSVLYYCLAYIRYKACCKPGIFNMHLY